MEQQPDIEVQHNREENNSDAQRESNKRSDHRLHPFQINTLERFFKGCSNPNLAQQQQLAYLLSLDAEQVKLWFQNKCSQMKLINDLSSAPRFRIGEASDIGVNRLAENNMLGSEIKAILEKYLGKPAVTIAEDTTTASPHLLFETGPEPFDQRELIRLGILPILSSENEVIAGLAESSADELIIKSVQNEEEYDRRVPPGFKSEISGDSTIIMADAKDIIGLLMNVNKWWCTFSEIISRAMCIKILSAGEEGSNNGALKVIISELQALSESVPPRKVCFVRYCKNFGEGIWVVADAPLDVLCADLSPNCRRRPSGCIVQELSNGHSQITWVEHYEVYDSRTNHVSSDLTFGANRWLSILQRQCLRQRNAKMTTPLSEEYPTTDGRRNLFLLAERVVIGFCGSLHAPKTQGWEDIRGSGIDNVKLMFQKCSGYQGRPSGVVVKASTSFGLPCSPRKVTDFLSDINSQKLWNVIFYDGVVREATRVATGNPGSGNCISVMQSVGGHNNNAMLIQETRTCSAGSLHVVAPVDSYSMDLMMRGSGNPSTISLLPSGFAILPVNHARDEFDSMGEDGGCCTSLVTVMYQILARADPMETLMPESIQLAKQLVARTVAQLKANLG